MALHRSDALVIRRFNLGEADRIVVFLTREQGKIRAVARAARRAKSKFSGVLEPLSHVHLEYYGKEGAELFRVNSVDVIHSFDHLRQDYEKVSAALVITELLDRLLEDGEPQPAILELTLAVLERMETEGSTADPLFLFEIRFLQELGYQPNLGACAGCGKDLKESGALFRAGATELNCPRCSAGGLRLSPGALKHLSAVGSLPLQRAFQVTSMRSVQEEVQRFLSAFLTSLSGTRLKSMRFFNP